ncbi:MAG TPA: glycine cleavage system aminomethyltransferase GcvT [Actinomycetota bacterium]|nr:glycine cleavage system aminomethyltransferase GcvT [Actinomycetota bacterium]
MTDVLRTAFHGRHVELGAKLTEFGGWEMPLQYPTGTIKEHLAVRRHAGVFDVSHMGRFTIRGEGAVAFLQHVLTNNVEALDGRPTDAQYTLIPNENGGAVDDAYLYRFTPDEYLLVVNAANREKDWEHLQLLRRDPVELTDVTSEVVMLALQGPASRQILGGLVPGGHLPEPMRNAASVTEIAGVPVRIARTGYTGEPVGFELFLPAGDGPKLWDLLVERGAAPCGLGARDTLRLEASLPLYGAELGADEHGHDIPIMAIPLARFGLSFADGKGEFIGRQALAEQWEAAARILRQDFVDLEALPRRIVPLAVTGRGIARPHARVLRDGTEIGVVTSGTAVPYWIFDGDDETAEPTDEHHTRAICLAYVDSDVVEGDELVIDVRGKPLDARAVEYHLRSEAPPFAHPIVVTGLEPQPRRPSLSMPERVQRLLSRAARNHDWRQRECINLIPSEMTPSPMVRVLQGLDPAFRYAEHRALDAFHGAEIYYYQGTEFIERVERLLGRELRTFLGAREVETRPISGQMANTVVFSAMVDYLNRADRRREPRRIGRVMNNHIGKGGHLSAQPMGALKDYVARDPKTERPAIVNFPVREDDPYRIDVAAAFELIEEYRPELIVFGKSMVLHPEPVAEVRRFLDEREVPAVVMYDMAHVLGLVGPHFQQPFADGADLVTGSTHKTFFGTQRGVVAGNFGEDEERYALWDAIVNRAFPGSVSNHHLGTLLGLLMAAYEMNTFKDAYQAAVIANAKAFARALREAGLRVEGDPAVDHTETHQVLVRVEYGRGPEVARRLEANNVICNYQALPEDESFTAASGLRMGVSEMTRFGMREEDWRELAALIADAVTNDADVAEKVTALRARFTEIGFCFPAEEHRELLEPLLAYV